MASEKYRTERAERVARAMITAGIKSLDADSKFQKVVGATKIYQEILRLADCPLDAVAVFVSLLEGDLRRVN